MKLLIDVGNSRTKWACYETQQITCQGVCDTAVATFEANLKKAWQGLSKPSQVAYCAVSSPDLLHSLEQVVMALWHLHARRLIPQARGFGLHCHYHQPNQLGADRWAAMIGAYARSKSALCVVDCGTAVTVDAVAENGQHQGGLIIPGQMLMRHALGVHTRRIGHVREGDNSLASVDTRGAVTTGCQLAVAAFVDQAVRGYQDLLHCPMRIFLTGGGAENLVANLQSTPEVIPELVILGLVEFLEQEP